MLAAAKRAEDFELLSPLLFNGKLNEATLWHCVIAVAQCGRKNAIPVLQKFLKTYGNDKRWEYQEAVECAETELESLT